MALVHLGAGANDIEEAEGTVSRQKIKLRQDPIAVFHYLKTCYTEDGIKLFSEQKDEMQQLQLAIMEMVKYEKKK